MREGSTGALNAGPAAHKIWDPFHKAQHLARVLLADMDSTVKDLQQTRSGTPSTKLNIWRESCWQTWMQ